MVTAGLELQLLHIRHIANKTLHSGGRFALVLLLVSWKKHSVISTELSAVYGKQGSSAKPPAARN